MSPPCERVRCTNILGGSRSRSCIGHAADAIEMREHTLGLGSLAGCGDLSGERHPPVEDPDGNVYRIRSWNWTI